MGRRALVDAINLCELNETSGLQRANLGPQNHKYLQLTDPYAFWRRHGMLKGSGLGFMTLDARR